MFETVNWIAIALATIASMAIGAGWYTFLAQPWIKANGFSDEQLKTIKANETPMIYIMAAVCHFIMAFILSGIIIHASGKEITFGDGVLTGFLVWLGFVATSMSVNHRFQFKPWSLTLIDSGHYLVLLLVQGAIIGWFGI